MEQYQKKYFIIIAVLILITIVVWILYSAFSNILSNNNSPSQFPIGSVNSPTPILVKSAFARRKLNTVPTLNPADGYGLNIESPEVKNSINEINKIVDYLPYKKPISSNGLDVEILIPSYELIENEWTLTVYIFGVNYQIEPEDPQYKANKQAFVTAAQDVFYFLKSKNIATENLIIQWGDRAFIQDISEEWLR